MTTRTTGRIGADTDRLSRVQMQEVLDLLERGGGDRPVEIVPVEDDDALRASRTHPGSPARVALLLGALLDGRFDALVLDAARMPARLPDGLTIGAITRRATPYEALLSHDGSILDELPDGATVAAESWRRQAQMRCYRPDLHVVDARGSVDSVEQRVRSGQVDAAVVAAADMERLQRHESVVELLTASVCMPAAGQGALAVVVRSESSPLRDRIHAINHPPTWSALRAEWAFLEHLGADDPSRVGVLCTVEKKTLELEGVIAVPDLDEKIHMIVRGKTGQEEELGRTLAREILEAGGRDALAAL